MKDNNYINDMSLSKGADLTGVSRSGITYDDNKYDDNSCKDSAQSNKNPKNITVEYYSENIPKKIKEQSTYMIKNKILLPVLAALSTALFSTTSMASTSTEFTSQDWQVACDNTRTCRLAGYQAENNSEFPVSILLVRRAGANAGVDGKVKLGGAKDSSSKALMQLGNRHRISLFINDKDYGETKPYSAAAGNAELTQAQVTALLEALTKSSKITLALRNSRWQLSDKGASAVMLKADEFQGRVGTSSAFIKNDDAVKSSGGILLLKQRQYYVLSYQVPKRTMVMTKSL
ncbi:DUF1176 domain-containing protein [Psychrobacter sp. JCM 18900]|uniref:DUF1176 domain-containing protein n=1 Tax=Psychrobacter sp. JCM 18900 TaxID=1298608 RepID=UPI0004B4353B|nr:DUF1176 domain-containing protein [Psychrobacter sp. JCM 18900]